MSKLVEYEILKIIKPPYYKGNAWYVEYEVRSENPFEFSVYNIEATSAKKEALEKFVVGYKYSDSWGD